MEPIIPVGRHIEGRATMHSLDSVDIPQQNLSSEKRMSNAELQKAILDEISQSQSSTSASDLVQKASRWRVRDLDVRQAIWALIELQDVELTSDRKLKLPARHAAAR
jgi:hypothetical protein